MSSLNGSDAPLKESSSLIASPSSPLRFQPEDVGVSPRRWLVLILFMLYGFSNQLQYVAYVTIVDEVKTYFDITAPLVNALAAIFPAVYVFAVYPGCKAYGHLGLRGGMLIGSGLNAAGSVVKLLSAIFLPNFWLLVVAGVMNAVGQVLFLGLPPLVASVWFPDDERTLATALGTLTGFVGMAVGMFYSPRVLNGFPNDVKTGMSVLMATQAVAACLPFIGVLIAVTSAPPKPPSVSANSGAETIPSVLGVLRRYLSNKVFVIECIVFGAVVGLFTALATVFPQLLKPLGLTETQTGVLAFVGILSGAISCAFISLLIDKYRAYKKPWLILLGFQLVMMVILIICVYTIEPGEFLVPGFIIIICIEMGMLPQFPVAMELAVELTYPEPESLAGSTLMVALSAWSIVGTVVFSSILGDHPTIGDARLLMEVMLGVLVLVWLSVFVFIKENLLRRESELSSPVANGKVDGFEAN